jgi:hypothetical protein
MKFGSNYVDCWLKLEVLTTVLIYVNTNLYSLSVTPTSEKLRFPTSYPKLRRKCHNITEEIHNFIRIFALRHVFQYYVSENMNIAFEKRGSGGSVHVGGFVYDGPSGVRPPGLKVNFFFFFYNNLDFHSHQWTTIILH